MVLNREIVEAYGLQEEDLADLIRQERPELERRRHTYRGTRAPLSITGKTAIIVDDGAATGTTVKVAVRALKRRSPRQIVIALPAAPPDAVAELSAEADLVICLEQPGHFRALGYHYLDFPQLSDDEVIAVMEDARQSHKASGLARDNKSRG